MKAAAVFVVAFLVLVGVTLLLPGFPPAQWLLEYLNIPQMAWSFFGISASSLLNGILNGFLWAIVATAVYGAARYAGDREPLPPMPKTPQLSAPPPEPMPVDPRTERIPPSLTVSPATVKKPLWVMERGEQLRIEEDVELIDGVGPTYGALLRNSGVRTVNDLLRFCVTERRRQNLANQIGVPYTTLLKWVYRGDLLRVRGVGRKYATLLESAGVKTVSDLSTRNPRYLSQALRTVNRERRLVRRTPPSKTIEFWVNTARTLEPIIQ